MAGSSHPAGGRPFRAALPLLALLAGAFATGFTSRILIGPLMVPVTRELSASNTEAGGFVLMVGLGMTLCLLGSGFVSRLLGHRLTVAVSLLGTAGFCLLAGTARDAAGFRAALFGLGAASGLYLPSAISSITALTRREDWGRAMSVHETAPNLSFVLAPLLAEWFVARGDWRAAFLALGLGAGLAAAACLFFGPGRGLYGEAPSPRLVRDLMARPAFWIMSLLFGLAVGASQGPYAMLPLHLVQELGLSREEANHLLSLSRVSGVFMAVVGGLCADRFGPRRTILFWLGAAGLLTACLGLARGALVTPVALLQPLVAVIYFPAGFAMLSRAFPWESRNLAVAFVMPAAALLGTGLVPLALGWCGDHVGFGAGFALLGGLMLLALLAARRLPEGEGG